MAIKILAKKDFMDTGVNTEASTRASEDSLIESDLSTKHTGVTNATLGVTSLVTQLSDETNSRVAFIGSLPDISGLTLEDGTTPVTGYSDAIAALYRKQVYIGKTANSASGGDLANVLSSASMVKSVAVSHETAINDLLAAASVNFDTFVELYNLTQGNRTNVEKAINTIKASLIATAQTKANRAQTEASTLVYLDDLNGTSTFNLVVDNGQLTIVEI